MNILLTSVGRRVELVRAFHAAYQSLGMRGEIIGIDIEPLAPALHECNRSYVVPRLNDPSYASVLIDICRREKVSLVFPLIDPDITNLAGLESQLSAVGAKLAAVDVESAEIAADKWRTAAFFRKLGLATPQSWLPDDPALGQQKYPLFIKPRRGSASSHTFRVRNAAELQFFSSYVPDPIIEELLPGPEITSDIVCDLEGEVLGVVSRKRIEVRGGEVLKGVTVRDDRIIDACLRIARSLRAHGPITVQCMMRDGIPVFTEINARFGGGFPLAIAAGFDGPLYLLARAAKRDVVIPRLGDYAVGLFVSRFDDSLFLTEDDRDAMASRRL